MSDKTNPTQSGRGILRRWRIAGIGLASAIALAGCNGTPGGEPTVTPATSILPSITATPTPSDDAEALFKEAEAVYREFFAEYQKVVEAGGASSLPPQFQELMSTRMQEGAAAAFREMLTMGYRSAPGQRGLLIGPVPLAEESQDFAIRLKSCQDERQVTFLNADGSVKGMGILAENVTNFVREGGKLKIDRNTTRKVEECTLPSES